MSQNRKKTFIAAYITLIAVIMLAAASYGWMTVSSSPMVSNMTLSLVTMNALEIAPDEGGMPGEWSTTLNLKDLIDSEVTPTLSPVTFSADEFSFLIPSPGLDGRNRGVDAMPRLLDLKTDVSRDAVAAADTRVSRGYLFELHFWARVESTNSVVHLIGVDESGREQMYEGSFVIGTPKWNSTAVLHENGGKGAENAVRVAFLADPTPTYPTQEFVIYEPNADGGRAGTTYSIDGDGKLLEGPYSLIRQRSSGFAEKDPVIWDEVEYVPGETYEEDDTSLFRLKYGEERFITLLIWIEGQDPDCTNAISEGELFAGIQIGAVENKGSNAETDQ